MHDFQFHGAAADAGEAVRSSEFLAVRFEEHRAHLRGVAYRMLGSPADADDAIQEGWLRLARSGGGKIDNLGGWLTTVVGRVCLDTLHARKRRGEEPLEERLLDPMVGCVDGADPEQQALVADSVGLALLVVLESLKPAERLAFVLHDMFGVPFEEIAPIVDRTPATAKKLASRARQRVRGASPPPDPDPADKRRLVDVFLAAARGGDFDGLLALLDPDVVVRADGGVRTGDLRGIRAASASVCRGGGRPGRGFHRRVAGSVARD